MHVEVSVALNFVISYLYNKLPRRRVDCFGEELEKALKKKFEGHWYPDKPFKGSGFRCIRISGEIVDPVMEVAATASGLLNEEIQEYLPADLTVWIDPCEVSYRIGEKGIVKVLYSNREEIQPEDTGLDHEIQSVSRAFNPEAQCFKPIDSLSSSLSNLSVSPSSPGSGSPNGTGSMTTSTSPNTPYVPRQSGPPMMTTAMFAQTKFGSTKLKSQVKRPARLSPTEFSSYLKQRAALQAAQGVPPNFAAMPPMPRPPSVHPAPVGPRDHRAEFIEHQHRLILAHQYGQALCSPVGGSPLGGSLNDLYGQYQVAAVANQQHVSYPDLLASAMSTSRSTVSQQQQQQQQQLVQQQQQQQQQPQQGAPSPDAPNKTFLDNLNSLPPYASLQHLLVAN